MSEKTIESEQALEEKLIEISNELVRKALANVTEIFKNRGWKEKELHSDVCCAILNAKDEVDTP